MDYYNYNFNPIYADSLDFLGSSKQKIYGIDSGYNPQFNRSDYSQLVRKESSNLRYRRQNINSSTSLILKKTTERKINQYSDFSCNNQYSNFLNSIPPKLNKISKNNPLIKVTVIPTPSTQNKLNKGSFSHTRVQTSVSNQENSIKARNVYVIIAGKKREKIYEIKTTGSADLSKNQFRYVKHDDIIEHNISQLLNSLNMDKKKKIKKKDEEYRDGSDSFVSNGLEELEAMKDALEDCDCNGTLNNRKSRVRITGRIGLTEDDRYILKCAATVDGKPVETNYAQEQRYVNYSFPSVSCNKQTIRCFQKKRNMNSTQKKEVNIQVNLDLEDRNTNVCNNCPLFMIPCNAFRSVETQCTPANFNTVCFSNIDQLRIVSTNRDQLVQCECAQTSTSLRMETENEKNIYSPKSCHSPLVVISVYPKQDSPEIDSDISPTVSKIPSPQKNRKRLSSESRDRSLKSRSPSTYGRSKLKGETKSQKTKAKGNSSGLITTIPKKTSRKEKVTQETQLKFRNTSKGVSNKTQNMRLQENGLLKKKEANVQASFSHEESYSPTRQKGRTGTKQDQLDTHKLTAHMNAKQMNWVSAKEDVSNVTINIDGKDDIYDVLLRQAGLITNLRVRKTIKDQISQKNAIDDESLENCLLVPDAKMKRSFSQTFLFNKDQSNVNADISLGKALPVLTVRDSIEVSHRRDEKTNDIVIQPPPPSVTTCFTSIDSKNKQSSAPIKHYRGDRCKLFNPVERDKEIRELLGIKKHKPFLAKNEVGPTIITREECPVHCIFHAKRNNNYKSTALYNGIIGIYNCTCEDEELFLAGKDDYSECYVCSNNIEDRESVLSNHEVSHKHQEYNDIMHYTREGNNSITFNDKEMELDAALGDRKCKKVQCRKTNEQPLYQQLILNRNVYIYLQIDQFTKQKLIVLSRKQYNKVKRTIESAALKSKLNCICKKKSSGFSVGEVRKKTARRFYDYSHKGEQVGAYTGTFNTRHSGKSTRIQSGKENGTDCPSISRKSIDVGFADKDEFDDGPRISRRAALKSSSGEGQFQDKKASKKSGRVGITEDDEFHHDHRISRTSGQLRKNGELALYTRKSIPGSLDEKASDNYTKKSINHARISLGKEEFDDHHNKSRKSTLIGSFNKGELDNHPVQSRRKTTQSSDSPYKITRTIATGDNTEIRKSISTITDEYVKNKPRISKRETFIGIESHRDDQIDKVKEYNNQQQQCIREKLEKNILSTEKSMDFKDSNPDKIKPLLESSQSTVDKKKYIGLCCGTCGEPVVIRCCGNCRRKSRKICPNLHNTCYHCTMSKQKNDVSMLYRAQQATKRHAASSTEMRYTSVAVMKHVTFSSRDFEKERKPSVANILFRNYESDSLHTLFKGHRKAPTPNLGTSAFSEYSDCSSKSKLEEKGPRKPFLKRLISCLVMRSKTSDIKINKPMTKPTSLNSSIDSYHINTSLEAVELSSSIYDTSASFFSSHSIQPVTNKMKRGILRSVKGLLTNRWN